MTALMNLLEFANLLGAAQGVFLALVLLRIQKGNRQANRLLAGLLFVFSCAIGHTALANSAVLARFPHLIRVIDPLLFLIGPLLYLYVQVLLAGALGRRALLHALPAVLIVLYLAPIYALPAAEKLARLEQAFTHWPLQLLVLLIGAALHLLVYVGATYGALRRHQHRVEHAFSSPGDVGLAWMRHLVLALAVVVVAWALLLALSVAGGLQLKLVSTLGAFTLSAIVYAIGYRGLQQPDVFAKVEEAERGPSVLPAARPPAREEQKEGKAEVDLQRLLRLMDDARPFTDPDLTLGTLAELIGLPPYRLSNLINEHLNQNFFEFVNGYRVEEVKRKLADPDHAHLTFVAIAFETGFNSKTAFNTAFKKHTGLTPTQFKQIQKDPPTGPA